MSWAPPERAAARARRTRPSASPASSPPASSPDRSGRLALLVAPFPYLLDDLGHEGLEIAGRAAGDDALVHHDLLVDPLAAGVLDVLADRLVGGEREALHRVGLDQQPRRMADRGDRLAGVEEGLDDLHGI